MIVNAALGRERTERGRPDTAARVQLIFRCWAIPRARRCVTARWSPGILLLRRARRGVDTAGLVVVGGDVLPVGAGAARLADAGTVRDAEVSVFGYPGNLPRTLNGGWSTCVFRGLVGGGLIQLDAASEWRGALRAQPGFSGAPASSLTGGAIGRRHAGDCGPGGKYAGRVPCRCHRSPRPGPRRSATAWCRPAPIAGVALTAADAAAGVFVGRESEVARLRAMVGAQPMVLVVGPSGVGKSSLVAAGLEPSLAADGWAVASGRPGMAPFDAVARALLKLELAQDGGHSLDELAARVAWLRKDGFWKVASKVALLTGRRLALIGDQFEEVLNIGRDAGEQIQFLERMLPAQQGWKDSSDVRLVCTLRLTSCPDPAGAARYRAAPSGPAADVSPLDISALSA